MARNPKPTKKKLDRRAKSGSAGGGRPRRGRPKICLFCSEHAAWVDYKDVGLLKRFMNDRGRIRARGATGTCAQHQRDVAKAVKTARELALLPYVVRTAATDSRGGRGGERRGNTSASPPAQALAPKTSGPPSDTGVEPDRQDDVVLDGSSDLPLPASA